jgi:hypothetical protein
MALLSAESANEIAALFNAFNAMVGINGCRIIHSESNVLMLLGDGPQDASFALPPIPMIQAGDTNTYLSADNMNRMIWAYNKIMASMGDGIITPFLGSGSPVIDVKL